MRHALNYRAHVMSSMPYPVLLFFQILGTRSYQEDRALAQHTSSSSSSSGCEGLLGVFDGHGGERTAELAQMWFPKALSSILAAELPATDALHGKYTSSKVMESDTV